jgi:hypothetical protein
MTRPTILDTADMVVVPKEPTSEQKQAGHEVNVGPRSSVYTYIYRAMLSASPHPTAWEEVKAWEAEQAKRIRELEARLEAFQSDEFLKRAEQNIYASLDINFVKKGSGELIREAIRGAAIRTMEDK